MKITYKVNAWENGFEPAQYSKEYKTYKGAKKAFTLLSCSMKYKAVTLFQDEETKYALSYKPIEQYKTELFLFQNGTLGR